MFGEEQGSNTRDSMVIKIGSAYYCYYTAFPGRKGAAYVRTSKDLIHWSEAKKVAYGGSPGNGPYSAEYPFVYFHKPSGYYYLLRNQQYGEHARFTVYRSKNPLDFGTDEDRTSSFGRTAAAHFAISPISVCWPSWCCRLPR